MFSGGELPENLAKEPERLVRRSRAKNTLRQSEFLRYLKIFQ